MEKAFKFCHPVPGVPTPVRITDERTPPKTDCPRPRSGRIIPNVKNIPITLPFFTAAIAGVSIASATPLTLQVDGANSAVTLSGTVQAVGASVPLQAQGANSLVANYSGAIPVDVTNGKIQFLGGSTLAALQPNDWQPGVGGVSGTAKASYAAKASISVLIFTANALAASRNVALDTTSAGLPITAGTFAADAVNFTFPTAAQAALDFSTTGAVSIHGSQSLSGLLVNNVGNVGTWTGASGAEILTLQVNCTFTGTTLATDGTPVTFHLAFNGQIVAKNAGTPEVPNVAFTLPQTSGAPLTLNWSKTFKLQRATILSPSNWKDVLVDPPYSVTPTQPGEFFQVISR